jgi:hypothetical protein
VDILTTKLPHCIGNALLLKAAMDWCQQLCFAGAEYSSDIRLFDFQEKSVLTYTSTVL